MKGLNKIIWSPSQMEKFSTADDLRISPFYSDGKTYGTPTWIWSVVVDNRLYVRAWNGTNSRWYRSAIQQKAGRIHLAGSNFEIGFIKVDQEWLNAKIDEAYRRKYTGSAYLEPMLQPGPRSSTLNIILRN